jgi:hypothetical protein
MSSSFQMWSATPAAIAARGDLGCQDVGSVKLTHYPSAPRLAAEPRVLPYVHYRTNHRL